jgi:hypothetical protein
MKQRQIKASVLFISWSFPPRGHCAARVVESSKSGCRGQSRPPARHNSGTGGNAKNHAFRRASTQEHPQTGYNIQAKARILKLRAAGMATGQPGPLKLSPSQCPEMGAQIKLAAAGLDSSLQD